LLLYHVLYCLWRSSQEIARLILTNNKRHSIMLCLKVLGWTIFENITWQ